MARTKAIQPTKRKSSGARRKLALHIKRTKSTSPPDADTYVHISDAPASLSDGDAQDEVMEHNVNVTRRHIARREAHAIARINANNTANTQPAVSVQRAAQPASPPMAIATTVPVAILVPSPVIQPVIDLVSPATSVTSPVNQKSDEDDAPWPEHITPSPSPTTPWTTSDSDPDPNTSSSPSRISTDSQATYDYENERSVCSWTLQELELAPTMILSVMKLAAYLHSSRGADEAAMVDVNLRTARTRARTRARHSMKMLRDTLLNMFEDKV